MQHQPTASRPRCPELRTPAERTLFFTGRRLDVLDKQDAGTPHHFTDDYAGLTLYDYRARTYDPALGRFGQRDAVARVERDGYASNPQDQYWDGASPYQYAKSSPSLAFDPSGLCCCFDPFYENDGVCRDILPGTICSCIKAIYRFDGKLMSRKVEWISDASAYSNCSKCKKKCFPLLVIVTPLVNLQVNKEIPTPFLPGWTIIESCRCNGLAWIWTCCKLPEPYVEH